MKSQQKKTPVKKQKQPSKTVELDNTITITGHDGTSDILSSPLTIGPIDMSSTYYTAGATVGGLTYASNIPTITTGSTGYAYSPSTWSNNTFVSGINPSTTVNITGDGLVMDEKADIKIGGKSLKEFMSKMEERMAILVPDPKKLEQFEALKRAYDNYKLMEKLCLDKPVEET